MKANPPGVVWLAADLPPLAGAETELQTRHLQREPSGHSRGKDKAQKGFPNASTAGVIFSDCMSLL